MADLELPSRVAVKQFAIGPWSPEQNVVVAPYESKTDPHGPAAFSFRGRVDLGGKRLPSDGGSWDRADTDLAAFVARLGGVYNRVKLPLPVRYRFNPPPDGASAVIASARIEDQRLIATVTATGFGSWRPQPGQFFNIGERLYVLESARRRGTIMTLSPPVMPVFLTRPTGLYLSTGGGGADQVETDTGIWAPAGLGVHRGILFSVWHTLTSVNFRGQPQNDRLAFYAIDVATGTRRVVLDTDTSGVAYGAVGSYGGSMYALGTLASDSTVAVIARIDVPSDRPSANRVVEVLRLTGAPSALTGMSTWTSPNTPGEPDLYATAGNKLYRAISSIPGRKGADVAWSSFFNEAPNIGGAGYVSFKGLAVTGTDGDPLYLLDTGTARVYTYDGNTVDTYFSVHGGRVGDATKIPSLFRAEAIEWYRGRFYVMTLNVGDVAAGGVPSGLSVYNDTPATEANVELAEPFVWARLSANALATLTGATAADTSFDWTEAAQ